jgi:hypothetical protein
MGHFINQMQKKIVVLYLNAETTSMRAKSKISRENLDQNFLICPKTENPIDTLIQVIKSIRATFEITKLLTSKYNFSRKQKILLLDITLEQFSRQTFSNLLVGKMVNRVSKELSCKNIIYSFEGNAYEKSIHMNLRTNTNQLEIFAYQHAPIVPSQFGLLNLMQSFSDRTTILTSGTVTRNYFQMIQLDQNFHIPIIEAGSMKFDIDFQESTSTLSTNRGCVLFLPEGDKSSFIEFFKIMMGLATEFKEIDFIIRSHPSLQLTNRFLR